MKLSNVFKVIGVMSGTSLDGLDLAYCEFNLTDGKWEYKLGPTQTIAYTQTWFTRLSELHKQPMFLLPKTDVFFGKFIGQCINDFIDTNNLTVDFISSHGHTIFHNPAEGYTTQIGSGAAMYAETGIQTICDFRSVDVAFGGQGAPLVPIGDELLFSEYNACLNLGGFANISYCLKATRVAFDICPCNIVLNRIAQIENQQYDNDGIMASQGTIHAPLLEELNQLSYYQLKYPKSLSREWVESEFAHVVNNYELSTQDILATFVEHIAIQIAGSTSQINGSMLITGGGALNLFLIQRLKHHSALTVIIPTSQLLEYKEALIFGFLGVLRLLSIPNSLRAVTGANKNSIGGAIFG